MKVHLLDLFKLEFNHTISHCVPDFGDHRYTDTVYHFY